MLLIPVGTMATMMTQNIDDGWDIERPRAPDTPRARSRMELIREALRILDGAEPVELELEGDGWSLVDPESVQTGDAPIVPIRSTDPLTSAIGAALDEAEAEGWLLADDEAA
jgi:hypothetical protein